MTSFAVGMVRIIMLSKITVEAFQPKLPGTQKSQNILKYDYAD